MTEALSMRERIARALWETWRKSRHATREASTLPWESLRSADRDKFPGLASLVDLAFEEADAVLEAMREPTEAMVEILLDPDSPFIARRKMDKSAYEVIEMTNDDWREVVSDDMVSHGEYPTSEAANKECALLEAKWRWSSMIDAAIKEGKE